MKKIYILLTCAMFAMSASAQCYSYSCDDDNSCGYSCDDDDDYDCDDDYGCGSRYCNDDYDTQRILDEADRVCYEANRSMRYDGRRPPRPASVIRYTDDRGRRHQVNRDYFGNYYDYSTFSNYEYSTNSHRNPRYNGCAPANGYYNGVVYIGDQVYGHRRPGYNGGRYNGNRYHNTNPNYNSNVNSNVNVNFNTNVNTNRY